MSSNIQFQNKTSPLRVAYIESEYTLKAELIANRRRSKLLKTTMETVICALVAFALYLSFHAALCGS